MSKNVNNDVSKDSPVGSKAGSEESEVNIIPSRNNEVWAKTRSRIK